MNVADFVVKFLSDHGVDTVFMITGGQAMFLNDAVFRNRKIKPIFTHHEQAAGMAAEAYGRTSGKLGVAMVTAGPGAINVLSGVVGAFVDSAPMMVVSGQSALPNVNYMENSKIRQLGLQGIYTKPLAKSYTKYFKTVDDPAKVLLYLEEAYHLATHGRTGPVWIEVPLDIQRMEVPEKLLEGFKVPSEKEDIELVKDVSKTLSMLYESKRPLLLLGQGVRLSGAADFAYKLLSGLKVPVVTTRLGIDLVNSDNPLYVGRPGLYANRAANFAVQNADLIICVGARLDTGIIGYDAKDWGRYAKKIVVEIDPEELNKPGIDISLKINADAKKFLEELANQLDEKRLPNTRDWIKICGNWKNRYPMVLPSYKRESRVNSYFFTQRLSEAASHEDVILVDTSSIFHVACQTWAVKSGQRFLTTGGISTMGYWVAGVGACLGSKKRRTIVITGDGSLQMNIQELATVSQNKLPIKIFVLNNNGYLLIRHTQKTHLGSRFMGESPKTGLGNPNFMDIAKAYGIKGVRIDSVKNIDKKIKDVLNFMGPVICEVMSPKWQLIIPRIFSERQSDGSFVSRPYEDLFPFLDRREFDKNMVASSKSK